MAGLATKKVGTESGLVPRLAGGGSSHVYRWTRNKRPFEVKHTLFKSTIDLKVLIS